MATKAQEDVNKANGKAADVLHSQKLAEIEDLQREFGVVVDVTNITMGELSDLADENTPFPDRMAIIQSLLSEGDARKIKVMQLERFMKLVTNCIDVASNPT